MGYAYHYRTVCLRSGGESNSNHIESLSRSQLQKLAKANKIKANMKTVDIVAALASLSFITPSTSEDILPKSEGANKLIQLDKRLTNNEEYSRILLQQGIDWRDIEELMSQIGSDTGAAVRPPSVKRGKKPKMNSTEEAHARTIVSPVKHLGRTLSTKDIVVPDFIQQENAELKSLALDSVASERTFRSPQRRLSTPSNTRNTNTRDTRDYEDSTIRGSSYAKRPSVSVQSFHRPSQKAVPSTSTNTYKIEKEPTISLHQTTLKSILEYLIQKLGFPALFKEINLRCFDVNPTVASSLKVLRQPVSEWARKKLEYLYIVEKKKES